MIEIGEYESPVGRLELAVRGGRLCALRFEDSRENLGEVVARFHPHEEVEATGAPAAVRDALARYFDGDIAAIAEVEVEFHGTPFQERVWNALRHIPAGTTISYSEVAAAAGRPRAVRAAGTATGSNRLAIVVPCHRVVRADGSIGNYGGGVDRKLTLLRHEGALS